MRSKKAIAEASCAAAKTSNTSVNVDTLTQACMRRTHPGWGTGAQNSIKLDYRFLSRSIALSSEHRASGGADAKACSPGLWASCSDFLRNLPFSQVERSLGQLAARGSGPLTVGGPFSNGVDPCLEVSLVRQFVSLLLLARESPDIGYAQCRCSLSAKIPVVYEKQKTASSLRPQSGNRAMVSCIMPSPSGSDRVRRSSSGRSTAKNRHIRY